LDGRSLADVTQSNEHRRCSIQYPKGKARSAVSWDRWPKNEFARNPSRVARSMCLLIVTQGVALGYYISRRWRKEINATMKL
jgi:hypothetical protein